MKELVERLNQLRYLKREVDELSQRIAQLELEAQVGSGRISGLPRSRRLDDRVARAAACIADLRDRMEARRLDCMEELGRLYAFIDDADDSLIRQILAARYIDGLSWQRIAMRIGEGDVLIGLSFPRYSSRTLKAMKFAKSKGATAIGITDNDTSPFHDVADICLYAKSDMVSFVDSLVAPLSLINALIVSIGIHSREGLSNTFTTLEQLWKDYDVFANLES